MSVLFLYSLLRCLSTEKALEINDFFPAGYVEGGSVIGANVRLMLLGNQYIKTRTTLNK